MAWIAEVLSKNSVNIRGISTDLGSTRPMIRVVTDDEASARSALKAAKLEFSEREIEVVTLADRPGELAKVAKTLSKSGINIESLYILGNSGRAVEEIALGVGQRRHGPRRYSRSSGPRRSYGPFRSRRR